MNIDDRLNELVFKYNIDKPVPDYRKYVAAYKIVVQLYENIKSENEIVFVAQNEDDLCWFNTCISDDEEKGYVVTGNMNEEMPDHDTCYMIISFADNEKLEFFLASRKLKYINIYKVLEEKGYVFQRNFYDVFGLNYYNYLTGEATNNWEFHDVNKIYFEDRLAYENAGTADEGKKALDRLIFDCVYAKDFVLLKRHIDEYIEHYGTNNSYVAFYEEISDLLTDIKVGLSGRNDVIMFWLDAMDHDEADNIRFLKNLDGKSLVLDNIFTVTPYTKPTFKTLFAQKRTIEEESYKISKCNKQNSRLIRELENIGYSFQYYGSVECVDKENASKHYYNNYTIITNLCWDAIGDVLRDRDRKFMVLHEIIQTHAPFLSLGLTGNQYNYREPWPGYQADALLNKKQALESREYVDVQLSFYADLLPDTMYKIYMSDHGHTRFGKYHPFMKIQQKNIMPEQCSQLLSYVNFADIILNILQGRKPLEGIEKKDYVIIQDVDYYYKDFILRIIQERSFSPDMFMSYQGIVTDTDMYIKYRHGLFFYQKRVNDGVLVTDERLKELDDKTNKKYIDVSNNPKFLYSKIYIEAQKKCDERNRERHQIIKSVIQRIFEEPDDQKRIAVRGGGEHSLRMLLSLPYELRRKVVCIIDNDVECLAGKLGIRVVTFEEAKRETFDIIVISSFRNREAMKDDVQDIAADQYIDIYEKLEKNGVKCDMEYYFDQYKKEDFLQGEDM